MSFRDGIYDSEYFRQQQNRRIREAELEALRAAGEARDRGSEVAHRKRSEKLRESHDEMHERKASLLKSISQSSLPGPWYERLASIDLTSPGAEEELNMLVQDIERERARYADSPSSDPPQWWKSVAGLDSWISKNVNRRPLADLDELSMMTPLGREVKGRETEEKHQREQIAIDLELIASALGSLITHVGLYRHYKDLPLDVYRSM